MAASLVRDLPSTPLRRQRGASLVVLALALFMLFAFAALAVDASNVYVARNELQNAADAGALAGARILYTDDGAQVNPEANRVARETALANDSQGEPVEVVSIQRGHWSFATRSFTPNPSLQPVDLFDVTAEELDANPDFINAVEVVTAREATPMEAFFGFVLGYDNYTSRTQAVGYIGFAGSLRPGEVDQPIGLCGEALRNSDGEYDCSQGRFIPSGGSNSETGGWSSFDQCEGACSGGTNTSDLRPLVCAGGNPDSLELGKDTATLGGQSQATFNDLYDCWVATTGQTELWNTTLMVIECGGNNPGPCNKLSGAVELNIAWMVNQANNIDADAPRQMPLPDWNGDGQADGSWSNSASDGVTRWNDFVQTFNIREPDGSLATWDSDPQQSGWQQKTIYFLPDCAANEPSGNTGGENFGVLARIPVLVD